jgi:ADP-ribosylglycohydrolase
MTSLDQSLPVEKASPAPPPFLANRIRGAIWGQFVGDAACLGSHWIYDLEELVRRYPEGLKGFEAPAAGHYHAGKVPGDQTHYGDAALLMLRSVAERGRFDAVDFGRRFVEVMASPGYTGYRDHATRDTLEKYRAFREAHPGEPFDFQQGADDDQPAAATRLVPVVAAHLSDGHLPEMVTAATRVCQNNDRAFAYMQCHALVLKGLFAGEGLSAAVADAAVRCEAAGGFGVEVGRKVREAIAASAQPVVEATLRFGQSCPLGGSFPAAVQGALAHSADFAAAVLATVRAGGDNAGRAALVGAWLGASLGVEAIPAAWRDRLTARDVIRRDVEIIVGRAA